MLTTENKHTSIRQIECFWVLPERVKSMKMGCSGVWFNFVQASRSSLSYDGPSLRKKVKKNGYKDTSMYLWINSTELNVNFEQYCIMQWKDNEYFDSSKREKMCP